MSTVHAVTSEEDAAAERWQQWQSRNAVASRPAAKQAGIAFTLLVAGLGTRLALLRLNPSLWP